MKLSPIVIKLRLADTIFNNYIGGAAELNTALRNTLTQEMAFVIPLVETALPNAHDTTIQQRMTERFAVVVALKNDSSDKEKTGIVAYDRLHDVRNSIFKAIVGWNIGYETPISYRGGRLLEMDAAWIWWQFEFEYDSRIITDSDGLTTVEEVEIDERQAVSQLPDFNKIYANIILSPSADLPYTGNLPLADGYPDVTLPDMATWIDETDDPNRGAFGDGFASGFDFYTET